MVKIIDNAIPGDIVDFFYKEILNSPMYIHSSVNITNEERLNFNNFFFNCPLNIKNQSIKSCCEKLIKYSATIPTEILRCYANIHFKNQAGTWHSDDGDLTFLWMISPTLDPGDGCFEIKDGEKINFVKNRLVIFKAQKLHRGNHTIGNIPRITIAIKTKICNNNKNANI